MLSGAEGEVETSLRKRPMKKPPYDTTNPTSAPGTIWPHPTLKPPPNHPPFRPGTAPPESRPSE